MVEGRQGVGRAARVGGKTGRTRRPPAASALLALAAAATIGAAPGGALAQKYPEKPVRLVVPFAPGGGTDVLARAFAPRWGEHLGQPVIVDNRPGAGGNIGADVVAKAAPDGYSVLFGSNTLAINAGLYPKLPFDTVRDFAPVGMIASAPMVLVAHPSVPARSVAELVAYAKANPDKVNFSNPGSGTPQHIAAELFNRLAGTKITHVTYKGGGPALTDLLAGQTQVSVLTMSTVKQHVAAGKLKAFGVATARRSQGMPELPTLAEAGIPGYEADLWYGLLVPAATPVDVVRKLNSELDRTLSMPEVRNRLTEQGYEIVTSTPERLGDVLRADVTKYGRLIREANLKAE